MRIIGEFIVTPVALFSLKAELASQAFGDRLEFNANTVKEEDKVIKSRKSIIAHTLKYIKNKDYRRL